MMEIKLIGIDLAKNVFQVHAVDGQGAARVRKTLSRGKLLSFLAQLPSCTVAMEACAGAHYWGRQIAALGHEVRPIPPQYVKPYRKGNKTDRNDAEAICEAALRPNMRFVPLKSEEQQALMAAQGVREQLIGQRTQLVNQIRGRLAEFGIIAPRGIGQVRALLRESKLEPLPGLMREVCAQWWEQLAWLDEQIAQASRRLQRCAQDSPMCRHLMRREGIGVINAVALSTQVDPAHFRNGRHLAAFLGVVPKEHSSGGKVVHLGITKRGNKQLRTLLIHGARALVRVAHRKRDPFSAWITQLVQRRGKHKAIVAAANKLARYVWVDMMQARQMGIA
jgi:transposase